MLTITLVLAQGQPSADSSWATVVASITGAIIAAVAALLGVTATQRSARRQAHADRVWKERSQAYLTTYGWANEWRLYHAKDPMKLNEQPPELLSADNYCRLQIYGSPHVVRAFEAAVLCHNKACHPENYSEQDPKDFDAAAAQAMGTLIQVIQRETQGMPK